MSGHYDGAVFRACEREADRIRDRLRALGWEPTVRTTLSTCPTEDAPLMLRQFREELRYVLLDRFGAELRADLDDAVSVSLLDRLADAAALEDYRVDTALSLSVVRLLRELLHVIEEDRPTWH